MMARTYSGAFCLGESSKGGFSESFPVPALSLICVAAPPSGISLFRVTFAASRGFLRAPEHGRADELVTTLRRMSFYFSRFPVVLSPFPPPPIILQPRPI